MTNELERERNQGLRVGYLVQRLETNDTTGPEGILVSISRISPTKRFTYYVDWQDGNVPQALRRNQIALTNFLDYPHYTDARLAGNKWSPGASHVWVTFDLKREKDYASCLYCMRIKQYMAEANEGTCNGPVRISFR